MIRVVLEEKVKRLKPIAYDGVYIAASPRVSKPSYMIMQTDANIAKIDGFEFFKVP